MLYFPPTELIRDFLETQLCMAEYFAYILHSLKIYDPNRILLYLLVHNVALQYELIYEQVFYNYANLRRSVLRRLHLKQPTLRNARFC